MWKLRHSVQSLQKIVVGSKVSKSCPLDRSPVFLPALAIRSFASNCNGHDHDHDHHSHDHSHDHTCDGSGSCNKHSTTIEKNDKPSTTPFVNTVVNMPMPPVAPISPTSSHISTTFTSAPKMSFIIQRFKYLVGEPELPVDEILGHFQDIVKAYKANPIAYARHTPKLLTALLAFIDKHGESSLIISRAAMSIYRFLGIVVPGGVNQLGTLDGNIAKQAFALLPRLEAEQDLDGCAEVLSLIATIPSKPLESFEMKTMLSTRMTQLNSIVRLLQTHHQQNRNLTLQGLHAIANILIIQNPSLIDHFLSNDNQGIDGLQLISTVIQHAFDDVAPPTEISKRKEMVEVTFGLFSILCDKQNRLDMTKYISMDHIQHILEMLPVLTPQESLAIAQSVVFGVQRLLHHCDDDRRILLTLNMLPWAQQVLESAATLNDAQPSSQNQHLILEREEIVHRVFQLLQQLLVTTDESTNDAKKITLWQKEQFLENQLCEWSLRLLVQELSSPTPSISVLTSIFHVHKIFVSSPINQTLLENYWQRFTEHQGPSILFSLLSLSGVDHPQVTNEILSLISALLPSTEPTEQTEASSSSPYRPNIPTSFWESWVQEGLAEETCRWLHHALHASSEVPEGRMLIQPFIHIIHQILSCGTKTQRWEKEDKNMESARQRLSDAGFPPLLTMLMKESFHSESGIEITREKLSEILSKFVQGETSFAAERRRLLFTQHNFPVSTIVPALMTCKEDNSVSENLLRSLSVFVTPVNASSELEMATINEISSALVRSEPKLLPHLVAWQGSCQKESMILTINHIVNVLQVNTA